jgi:protein O-mannosyl-transferase
MLIKTIKNNLPLAVFLLFLVLGMGIYADSFGNKLFWDDDDLIAKNIYVQNFQIGKFFSENEIAGSYGQVTNYWRPFLLLTFAIDYKLWGAAPFGYHLANTFFHILAAWLAFIFLYRLIEILRRKRSVKNLKTEGAESGELAERDSGEVFWLSFLPALIFLLHPLQTEAVAYVAGRGDPLSAVLVLLSLIFYLYFLAENKKTGIVWSAVFFVLGLLIKEQVIFLPALILLVAIFIVLPRRGSGAWKKIIISLLPFAAITIIYAVLRLTVLNFSNILSAPNSIYEGSYSQNIFVRLFTFTSVMLLNLKLLFFPVGLVMQREIVSVTSFFSWPVVGFILAAGTMIFVCWKTWKKEPLISFGLLWFFILLLPRTNILKINRPMYEHWLYLPMVGFWLAFFALLFLIGKRLFAGGKTRWTKAIFCGIVIICCVCLGIMTVLRNRDWRNPIVFYENNLRYVPNSFIEHNNLGMAYADAGRSKEAIEQYRKAIAINDIYPQVHYNLANSLANAGEYDEAEKEYLETIKMDSKFELAYQNLYYLYNYLGEKDKAQKIIKTLNAN